MWVRMRLFFGSTVCACIPCAVATNGKFFLGGSAISMVSMCRAVSVLMYTFIMAVFSFLFVTAKNQARRYCQEKSELFHF
jgi:hypothetical protein